LQPFVSAAAVAVAASLLFSQPTAANDAPARIPAIAARSARE
jgi:hypothetical protein